MSVADPPSAPEQILEPYFGARRSRLQRRLRRAIAPLLVVFSLLYGAAFGLYGPFYIGLFPIPIAILMAVIIWALPEMKTAPTRSMTIAFFAFFLSLLLWPNYIAVALPGLPWITMTRLFGAPMTLLLLICISTSADFRRQLREALSATPWVWKLLVAFSALQMLSVVFSDRLAVSAQKAVNAEINWLCIYFVSVYVFLKPGRPTLWAKLFCLTLPIICAIVFKEHAMGQVPWADHIPSFLKIQDESVQRMLAGARRAGGEYRVQGIFTTPLGLGEYIALLMPFLIHFIASPIKPIFRIGAALMAPIAFQVVLWSDSRLGLIGCILSYVFYLLLWAIFLWRNRRDSVIAPSILLAYPLLAIITFVSTLVVGRFRNKVWGTGQYDASNQGRIEMYQKGIPMVIKHPWGYGPGRGAEKLGITNPSGVLTIDTYYMLIALEYGVIGFLLYYGTLAFGVGYSSREALKQSDPRSESMLFLPLLAALTNFILIKSVFSNDENHPLVFMILGMITALCWRFRKQPQTQTGPVSIAAARR
jgi:O-antigen ligase